MTKIQKWSAALAVVCLLVAASCGDDEEPSDAGGGDAFCEGANDEADQLLRAAQSCEQDDDCTIVGITAPCLILCSSVVNSDTDLAALRAEAMSLSDDYQEQCAERDGFGCPIADCSDPSTLRAKCSDGLCTNAQ